MTSSPGGDADLDQALVLPFALLNGGDTLALMCQGFLTDFVEYNARHVELGVSIQKDANSLDVVGSDLDEDWCPTPQTATYEYTQGSADAEPKYGTPGAANVACSQ